MTSEVRVTRLSIAPVKGTRLQSVDRIELGCDGAVGDRRFFVIDDRDRMVNSKTVGALQTVVASCADGTLRLSFADGSSLEAPVSLGAPVEARFYSTTLAGRLLEGSLSEALSERAGRDLRLVVPAIGAIDRGARGAASLISTASLECLASEAGVDSLDSRRFRMLIEIDGVAAHHEDRWVGERVRIGEATIRFLGHVGRCLITSREPETGVINLPTLDVLSAYRGGVDSTEPLPFGVYGEVLVEGGVAVGDTVTPVE